MSAWPAATTLPVVPTVAGARTTKHRAWKLRRALRILGPGLVSGAADDDPSGISTYSQAGAAYGFGLLWTALVSFPLMVSVQLMCARIGIVADCGLASVLRAHYARPLLWFACALLLVANTVNIAADLGGMAAAASLVTGWPAIWFVPAFAVLVLALLILASYEMMTAVLKWMTLALFAYVFAAFLAHPNWWHVLNGTFLPHVRVDSQYLLTFVAILGTTISPYLFFWQASQEAEAEDHVDTGRRRGIQPQLDAAGIDTNIGMLFSNMIMYFIILTTGATLHVAGKTDIQTAAQAAAALRPVAGPASALLFTLGIVGTGMLGVPVLAGSAAYAVTEASGWRHGMDEKLWTAPQFYAVIAVSTIVGAILNYARVDAIRMLFWSAVVNGLLAPPLIIIILVVCNNRVVMGRYRNGLVLNILGGAAALLMTGAAVALIASWILQ
jgi:NRAMP (natural resistance-associated macrophage protein)-like metal ion transporter